jgi:hypothetical protein
VCCTASETGERFDHVVLLQPTSPLRTGGHDDAIGTYLASGEPSLISVCDVGPSYPECMYRLRGSVLQKFLDAKVEGQRQCLRAPICAQWRDLHYLNVVSRRELQARVAESSLLRDGSHARRQYRRA